MHIACLMGFSLKQTTNAVWFRGVIGELGSIMQAHSNVLLREVESSVKYGPDFLAWKRLQLLLGKTFVWLGFTASDGQRRIAALENPKNCIFRDVL